MEVDVVAGRPTCERAERLGTDEPLSARRDERHDLVATPDKKTANLARLVGRDPAGNP
jgi:hypothetical protein